MCEYLSFVSVWDDGKGLQAYSNTSLSGHAEAPQLWGLPDDALRWSWEADGEENLRLSHGHETTPETERARLEVLRLWPTRENLTNYLVAALWRGGKVGRHLYLGGCTGLTALPPGLHVGGSLDLGRCTGLTALPDGLSVGGDLDLGRCTGLTALPDGLSVRGDIYLPKHLQRQAFRELAKQEVHDV